MRILQFLLTAIVLLLPASALADYTLIQGAVNSVGSGLPFFLSNGTCAGNGACGFVEIAEGIVDRFRPGLTIVAVFVIVLFGYRMMVGQEDDVITKARAMMSGTIAGLIMVYLIDPFIHAFYGSGGEVPQGAIDSGVAVLTAEVSGVINWVLTITAALAVLMLIVSAAKAVGQSTGEEGIANMRKTIFSVILGIVLLVFRFVLSQGFVETTGNPAPVLATILIPISFVMGFLALAAVIVVVYAGILCILSMGSEENFTKAKSLLIRAGIGAIVILLSLALVNFVVVPGVQ